MAAELLPYRREQLVGVMRLAARAEALVERGGQHGHRDALVDRGADRPAPLAGVRDAAAVLRQVGASGERRGGEVEQPGRDDAAAAPHLGDLGYVDVVAVVLGLEERRDLGA